MALSYGKRMLKEALAKQISFKRRKRQSPDADAEFFCNAGFDREDFEVKYISDYKGFGVFSKTPFEKGDFLLEYAGERISIEEAEVRERKNPANMMFYFSYNGKRQCIDASGECSHICQYVNDNHNGNSVMKLRVINKVARLCLFAKKDINYGEEILYDYGDKQSLW